MCLPMCDYKLMFFCECVLDYVYICLTVFVGGKGGREGLGLCLGVNVTGCGPVCVCSGSERDCVLIRSQWCAKFRPC